MTTELTYFTAQGFYYDIQSANPSSTTNTPVFAGITGGFLTFTPRVPPGFTVWITDLDLGSGNTGSVAVALPAITGRVMSTPAGTEGGFVWELCTINVADTPGIQLLANSSPISTYLTAQGIQNGNLIYDVSFSQVTYDSGLQTISSFAFVAPTSATTVVLTDPSFQTIPYQQP
jgi:hypothetical protein